MAEIEGLYLCKFVTSDLVTIKKAMKQVEYEEETMGIEDQLRSRLQPLSPNNHLVGKEYDQEQYATYFNQALIDKKIVELIILLLPVKMEAVNHRFLIAILQIKVILIRTNI
ncbi:protein of unknown function [Oenococcus oeni]|uniref:hypothetical protein n=1 Tax=Oenococcus oeni TaxID=1247 RepID=UPI00107C186C|nr:hypothetical protein [Oenococcus oeni]AVI94396.1 hypothetical protein AX764_05945 [Oenococcus oeni]SYW02847.1 hypothetical protein OENI_50158 [Oenococcus oeni]SYW03454.1 hypothetical protein OENI_410008 [Oenococcus oeni]SYW19199.1 hypothetical protein OENI_70159 [Oenococcus oeni]VDC14959.1 protein of unknown function [Oenococcus oeni]